MIMLSLRQFFKDVAQKTNKGDRRRIVAMASSRSEPTPVILTGLEIHAYRLILRQKTTFSSQECSVSRLSAQLGITTLSHTAVLNTIYRRQNPIK
jgi:hypothetical protein